MPQDTPSYRPPAFDRRRFLKQTVLLPIGAALGRGTGREGALMSQARRWPRAPVRVRGRVQSRGVGLAGVAVTDGLQVVPTRADGTFDFVSDGRRPFVYLSQPAGFTIATNPSGTARFYQPLRPDGLGEAQAVFDLSPRAQSDAHHVVLVTADPQPLYDHEWQAFREETCADLRATAQAVVEGPVFGLMCGDLVWERPAVFFPSYEEAIRTVGVPFFQVFGNHDAASDVEANRDAPSVFHRHFGPDYYSFNVGAVHYVVLNDVVSYGNVYLGALTADQLDWLTADLALVEPGTTVIVAVHIPVYSVRDLRLGESGPPIWDRVSNRDALYRRLEPYTAHILSGHLHNLDHVFEGGVHEHIQAALCGSLWCSAVASDGTPAGYGVYEVRGSDLRWQYKAVGHPTTYQMRTYPHGADPAAPDEVVACIWNWDPDWTIVWYEDGIRVGAMARRVGLDPFAVEALQGASVPRCGHGVDRTCIEPFPTDLFYAPASRTARRVHIEATDGWGRTYTAGVE